MDQAKELVCGADGNIYAAGLSEGSGTYWDLVVISLTPADSERWVCRQDGQANYYDLGTEVVWGDDGNVYAGGYSDGTGTAEDLTVASLAPSGSERWVYRYDCPGLSYDVANDLVFGSDGNVYAAGLSTGIGTGEDFTIVSLDPTSGVAECPKPRSTDSKLGPSIIHGVLVLPGFGTRSELPERNSFMSRTALLDISGRKVMGLHPGANDVRMLAPGVYFVREAQARAQAQAVRKVVVAR